jgi:hypothetical protein
MIYLNIAQISYIFYTNTISRKLYKKRILTSEITSGFLYARKFQTGKYQTKMPYSKR